MPKRITDEQFKSMMEKATQFDRRMEHSEAKNDLAPPKRCPLDAHLQTAHIALETAIKVQDWNIVCEGMVLLQQAITRVRPAPDFDIEQRRKESLVRREEHPDWPSHKPTLTEPHTRRVTVFETMPIGKAKIKGYCKYCHKTHEDWWEMDPREGLGGAKVFLCGNCEHTSLETYM